MALRGSECDLPSIMEQSNTLQHFKRQYCLQREVTLIDRVLNSERAYWKVAFSLVLFLTVMVIGGFVTKWCEYNRYDEVVEEDLAFREQIRTALNSSDLFDELDATYAGWVLENPWTDGNSLVFWLTLMTTIGYGDIYPITTEGRLWTVIFGIISIFTSALVVRILGNSHKDIFTHKSKTFKKYPKTCLSILFISSALIFALIFYFFEHDTGVGPLGDEGWSYTESFYFVIMTITTVGFGDFVPHAGITVVLIIYGIIMLMMLVGEAEIMVKRLESDMRMIIDLAEQGYNQATNAARNSTMQSIPEPLISNAGNVSTMGTIAEPFVNSEVELQKKSEPPTFSAVYKV